MKNLISKSMVKIFVAIVLCAILSLAVANFAPHISNDMAIGQLENDDMSWTAMQTWNQVVNGVGWVQAGIGVLCAASVGKDTIKYIKNRKENEENEAH